MPTTIQHPIKFHLTNDRLTNLQSDFQKIIDYLLTYVGEIEVKKENDNLAHIIYTGTNISATLKAGSPPKVSDSIISGQITLTCNRYDNVSINLIRNVTKNIGLRIYNPQTESFLVNDPNLLDLTTHKMDENLLKIFSRYGLSPFLQHNGSLVFFARDKKGRVRLVNRHVIEYLSQNPGLKVPQNEFSAIVAKNIGEFVALSDRGIIPISFHRYLNSNPKIANLNGMDPESAYSDLWVSINYFGLDGARQSFSQTEISGLPQEVFIKKGKSIIKKLEKEFKLKNIHNYIAIKIAQDVGYKKVDGRIFPIFSLSVFFDESV